MKRTSVKKTVAMASNTQQLPSVIELLQNSWQLVTARFGALLGLGVVSAVTQTSLFVVAGLAAFGTGIWQAIQEYQRGTPLSELVTPDLLASIALVFVLLMLALIVQSLLIQLTVLRVLFNPKERVMDAFRRSVSKFWPVLGGSALVGVITFGGMWLLLVPGFVFSLWFMFGVYEVLLYNTPVMTALNRSAAVARKHFWGIFGRFSMLVLLTLIVGTLFDEVARSLSDQMQPIVGLASMFYQALMGWIWVAAIGVLYKSVRDEKASSQSVTVAFAIAALGWLLAVFVGGKALQVIRGELRDPATFLSEMELFAKPPVENVDMNAQREQEFNPSP